MNKPIVNIEELQKIFQNVDQTDPIIKFDEGEVRLIPFWENYSFLSNFIPIIFSIIILIQQDDFIINLICFIIIIGSLYFLIWTQLKYYNKIVFNIKNKSVMVFPNIITKLSKKEYNLSFADIENINYRSTNSILASRRFIITITTNNKELELISTQKEKNAQGIVAVLLMII